MPEQSSQTEPFAYILIVESEKELRESALRTIVAPNCAVDVARDEDEAVHKALHHRPQLIIVKLHQPLEVDPWNPPSTSLVARICRRAHLSRAVRLATHSDVAITVVQKQSTTNLDPAKATVSRSRMMNTFSDPQQLVLMRPKFKSQEWRKEWYLYCSQEKLELLSDHLPFWLGRSPYPPYFLTHHRCMLEDGWFTLQKHWNIRPLDAPYILSREPLYAWKRPADAFPN